MFTGIVEELGTVVGRAGGRLRIAARTVLEDAGLGDSIAVNGCCLTIVSMGAAGSATPAEGEPGEAGAANGEVGWWEADVSDETRRRTTLGELEVGDLVNLERPVRLADRLGGHLVQGHVDTVGTVVVPAPDLRVEMDPALTRYVVEKGSIAVDGVSLTVVDALADGFTVAIIPHTADVTTLGHAVPDDRVNLEVDVTAKYVERLLAWHEAGG